MNFDWPNTLLSTALGVPLAIYLHWLARPRGKILAYTVEAQTVLDNDHAGTVMSDVTLAYKDIPIPRLSVSKITFWNGGDQTFDKDALVAAVPLAFGVPGEGAVLDV